MSGAPRSDDEQNLKNRVDDSPPRRSVARSEKKTPDFF